jgi:parallel beta-helix repeat protein
VYEAAKAGNGYDKVISLSPEKIYTGGISVSDLSVCINGNGALIDLKGGRIEIKAVFNNQMTLRLERCVITNGDPGLDIASISSGVITNNTFFGNTTGIKIFYCDSEVKIINNIVAFNSAYGLLCNEGYYPHISYNDFYSNQGGEYIEECSCPVNPFKMFIPNPGTGNLYSNPVFLDTANNDFTLGPGSPCIDAGTADSIDMGAIESADIGIENPHISAVLNPRLSIFPNPSRGNFKVMVNLPDNQNGLLELFNALGKRVRQDDWDLLSPGVYIFRLQVNSNAIIKKLIVVP